MRMTLILNVIYFSLLSFSLQADFIIDLANNFSIDEGDVENLEFSKMSNRAFLGASLDDAGKFYFGQNISSFSREFKVTSGTSELSVLELGPRVQLYFNDMKTIFITLAWNPYLKGDRTNTTGASEEISGSSILGAIGYQMKLSKKFHLGGTLNYHSISISKSTDSSNVESDVSQSYSSIYPMIELSFRFR